MFVNIRCRIHSLYKRCTLYRRRTLIVIETECKKSYCGVIRLGRSVLETRSTTLAKQSCTQQLERQHAVSKCSSFSCPNPLGAHCASAAARGMMTKSGPSVVKTSKHQNTLVPRSNREDALPIDEPGQREQSRRHRHQDTECRQNRPAATAAGNERNMTFAG